MYDSSSYDCLLLVFACYEWQDVNRISGAWSTYSTVIPCGVVCLVWVNKLTAVSNGWLCMVYRSSWLLVCAAGCLLMRRWEFVQSINRSLMLSSATWRHYWRKLHIFRFTELQRCFDVKSVQLVIFHLPYELTHTFVIGHCHSPLVDCPTHLLHFIFSTSSAFTLTGPQCKSHCNSGS